MSNIRTCSECALPVLPGKSRCPSCHQAHLLRNVRYNTRLKQSVIDHYGGSCVVCGFANLAALTLHHMNDDGAEHRQALAGSSTATGRPFYRKVKAAGYPPGLEVLCANCHQILHCVG